MTTEKRKADSQATSAESKKAKTAAERKARRVAQGEVESNGTLSDSTPAPPPEDIPPVADTPSPEDRSPADAVINEEEPNSSTSTRTTCRTIALNTKEMKHLDPELIDRIRTIANYAHEASRTYAFDLLPADTTWGLRPKFSKGASAAKTLCLRNSMDACVVWFVGRISKLWFYNQDHVPQSPVKVVIDPWSLGTTLKLRKKLKSLSQPQAEPATEDPTLVRATRMMGAKGAPADHFVDCFDARKALKSKDQMDTFNVADLNVRDTVVIECNISRVWNKPEGKSSATSWYGFLHLKTIALIHQDVSATDEDPDINEALQDEGLHL